MDCSIDVGDEDPRVECEDDEKHRERTTAKGKWAAEESSESSSSDSDEEPIDPSVRLGRRLERADIRGENIDPPNPNASLRISNDVWNARVTRNY